MKRTINYILSIGVAAALNGCGSKTPEKTIAHHEETADVVEITDAQYKTAGIQMGKVEMRTISGTISASGMLDVPPQSKVSISAPMGGFVKSTDLLQGSRVQKGQVVVIMQHPDYIQLQQNYLETTGQLEFLKSEYERQEELAKENVNAKKALQQARANYLTAKATIEGLKAKLRMLNINLSDLEKGNIQQTISLLSPISGYVTKVKTNIGAFVNPTDVLVEIVNTEHLHAELTIFEKDVPLVKIGQRVLFTLANETKHRVAMVHLIGREISEDRSVQVHCEIQKEDPELIPGMYLKAIIETDSAHVTALPDEALVNFEGKTYVFIGIPDPHGQKNPDDHHFKLLEVKSGETELGYTQVVLPDNFDLDTPIVVKGAFSVLAKMKNAGEEEE